MSRLTRIGERSRRLPVSSVVFRWRRRCLRFLIVLLPFFAGQAARGTTVSAQLDRNNVAPGDTVQLQIVVVDSSGGTVTADMPRMDGLEVQRSGSGWRFENGRRSDILNFIATPSREGEFVIPAIPVRVNGQKLQTNPLKLTVRKGAESAEMRLVTSVSKKECFTLEPVDVTVDWYISSSVRRPELNIPLLEDKDELSLKAMPPAASANTADLVANRYELTASRSLKEVDGVAYTVLSLRFQIFPPQPGSYTIRPATVVAYVQSGYKMGTDVFGFRTPTPDYRRLFATSEPVALVVRALPDEGKPAGFAGAVGKFGISLETKETQVRVGDPIPLRIIISGTGLLEKIKRPLLSQAAAFANDFSINESLAPGDVSGNRVTFEQTIRAKSTSVKEIPSVAFAYFDPDQGQYAVVRSRPVPITVLSTTEVTANDVIKFGPEHPAGEMTTLEKEPGGILANYTHLDALRNQAVNWRFLSFLGVAPMVYVAVLCVVTRRRKLAGDVALARSKSARRVLKRHLSEARKHLGEDDREFYDSLARAVSRFTSDKLNLGTGELTAYDVEMLVRERKVDEETSRKIAEVLNRCDAGRFSPTAESAEDRVELLRRAEELTKTLGKRL